MRDSAEVLIVRTVQELSDVRATSTSIPALERRTVSLVHRRGRVFCCVDIDGVKKERPVEVSPVTRVWYVVR